MVMKSDRSFLLLIILIVISRLPLLFGGFGTDGDAWRIAKSAMVLWDEGIYHVSRFPGFPVYELLQTPIIALGGSMASNSASLIIFIFSVIVFRSILRRSNVPHPDLLLISYSFLPILWKNSAVTMDYVWGLFGLLASFSCILRKKNMAAGIILGLAAGTRLSHIAFIFPFFFLFEKDERKQWLALSVCTIVTTIVCYLPVIRSEEFLLVAKEFINDAGGYSPFKRLAVFSYRIIYSIGSIGWLTIFAVLFAGRRNIPAVFQSPLAVTSVAMCLTGLAVFAILPDEKEYLIPVFPFFLLLLSHIANRKQFAVITAALLSYGFVSFDLIEHSVEHPRVGLNIQRGYVIKEYMGRQEINEKRSQLARTNIRDSSFVMIGLGPMFWLENPLVRWDRANEKKFRSDCAVSLNGREVHFIYALYKPQLDELRRRGYTIYYWNDMKEYLQTFVGYDLDNESVQPVNTSR